MTNVFIVACCWMLVNLNMNRPDMQHYSTIGASVVYVIQYAHRGELKLPKTI